MNLCNNFRTRTFGEIFYPTDKEKTSYDTFKEKIDEASGIPLLIKEESLQTIFYLLYAAHAADHIASNDESQFLYKLQSIIFMYGPTWEKRLEVQSQIRQLDLTELSKGGEAIFNSAQAPGTSTAGLVDSEGKLDFLNGQNTETRKRGIAETYATLLALLETDVTKEFIDKFKKLFVHGIAYRPLWYATVETSEEETEE